MNKHFRFVLHMQSFNRIADKLIFRQPTPLLQSRNEMNVNSDFSGWRFHYKKTCARNIESRRFQLYYYSKIRIERGGWGVSSSVLKKAFPFGLAISTNTVNSALFPEQQIKGRTASRQISPRAESAIRNYMLQNVQLTSPSLLNGIWVHCSAVLHSTGKGICVALCNCYLFDAKFNCQ